MQTDFNSTCIYIICTLHVHVHCTAVVTVNYAQFS